MDTQWRNPLNLFLLAASGCKHHHMVERERKEQIIRSKILKGSERRRIAQMYYLANKETKHGQTERNTHIQTAVQSPKGHKIALSDCCPISFLSFCCDGCRLWFYVFHSNCQSVSRKQEGWRVWPRHKGGACYRAGLVLYSLWFIAIWICVCFSFQCSVHVMHTTTSQDCCFCFLLETHIVCTF